MSTKIIESLTDVQELAFICDELEPERGLATLRTASIDGSELSQDTTETFYLSHFTQEYSVSLRKGAAGVIHFYTAHYSDGSKSFVTASTVFPEGNYINSRNLMACGVAYFVYINREEVLV